MTDRPMLTVYCYDVADERVRSRVSEMLEKRATRVQESVFEARLPKTAADRLFDRLLALLMEGDKLRMYAIGASGLPRCRSHGGGPIGEEGDFWIV